MIAGELRPTSGRILFCGEDVAGLLTYQVFHRGIVRIFQIPHEFAKMTVLENLMVVPPAPPGEHIFNNWLAPSSERKREREVHDRARDALEFLSISHLRDERAGNLSGGQKKLLELGRTMMTDAMLVLLDEPGAGVKPTLLVKIREMIASLCNPVIVLSEGCVLAQGEMAQVRRNPQVLEAYLGGAES
jgi:branched-chain amino acid transport system ATP-binding protein